MALFTTTQADACIIKNCTSIKKDGVHICWSVTIKDEDGYTINWEDTTTSGSADDATIKTAMKTYLTTNEEKKPAAIPVITEVEKSSIIDTTIG